MIMIIIIIILLITKYDIYKIIWKKKRNKTKQNKNAQMWQGTYSAFTCELNTNAEMGFSWL